MNSLLKACREALLPLDTQLGGRPDQFRVIGDDDFWYVRLENIEVEEEGSGGGIVGYINTKPERIENTWDVLHTMLWHLANHPNFQGIDNVTVDGGNDCEAIFYWNGCYWALKVR